MESLIFGYFSLILILKNYNCHLFYGISSELIDTQTKANVITENQAFEICPCNLTPYICDPLCCCDPDCQNQVSYWQNQLSWQCEDSITDSKNYCYPNTVMRRVNVRRGIQVIDGTDSKTGCVKGASQSITNSFIGEETISNEKVQEIRNQFLNKINSENAKFLEIPSPQQAVLTTLQQRIDKANLETTNGYSYGDFVRLQNNSILFYKNQI